jgi:hypothetical protein
MEALNINPLLKYDTKTETNPAAQVVRKSDRELIFSQKWCSSADLNP